MQTSFARPYTRIRVSASAVVSIAVLGLAACKAGDASTSAPTAKAASVEMQKPVAASLPTGVGAAPVVALAQDGARALAWVSAPDGGTDGRLYVSVDNAAPVELKDSLGPIEAHGESPPKLVFDSKGGLHALYVVAKLVPGRRFPTAALRHIRSEDRGKTWSVPANVTDASQFGSNNFHSMHVSGDGVIYAAWLDGRDGKSATYMTRSDDAGRTWSPNLRVAPGESCPCCRTAIASAPGGHVYMAWRGVLAGNVRDIVVAHSSDGGKTFGSPVRVHADDWVYDACPHAGPSMQVDSAGRLHVAWWTGKDKIAGVYYAHSDDVAQTFSAPIALGTAEFSRPAHVQLSLGTGGRVLAVWDDGTLQVPEVLLRASRDGGLTFSAAQRVSNEGQWASFPMLRVADSTFTVVWSEEPRADAEHTQHSAGKRDTTPKGLHKVGASQVFMTTGVVR